MELLPAVRAPGKASLARAATFVVAFAIVTLKATPAFGLGRRRARAGACLDRDPRQSH